MFGRRKVDLKLTPRAWKAIEQYKAISNLAEPILRIGWGKWSDELAESWSLGIHDRGKLNEGWIGIADDLEFVVIQEWILSALDGKTLDVSDKGVIVE